MCFFSAKAFLMSAIVTAKIVYLCFLASHANRVAPIIQMSIVLSKLQLSTVSCIDFSLALSSMSGIESVSDLGSGSSNILFIVDTSFYGIFM